MKCPGDQAEKVTGGHRENLNFMVRFYPSVTPAEEPREAAGSGGGVRWKNPRRLGAVEGVGESLGCGPGLCSEG